MSMSSLDKSYLVGRPRMSKWEQFFEIVFLMLLQVGQKNEQVAVEQSKHDVSSLSLVAVVVKVVMCRLPAASKVKQRSVLDSERWNG